MNKTSPLGGVFFVSQTFSVVIVLRICYNMLGDLMINQENIEALFDCFNRSATLLYKTYKLSYIEGLVVTCENIMANQVEDKYSDISDELLKEIELIASTEFQKEEIRKAFQYACLRGLKHKNVSNQQITPDTIGIFMHYLISKLYDKKSLSLLDPLVGTGNLATTIANQSDLVSQIIGVDYDDVAFKLASALFDMQGYGNQVYFQDTLTFIYPPQDLIVTDLSGISEETSYQIIEHYKDMIIDGGFFIGIFDDPVIAPEILVKHQETLSEYWKLFGMIKLPNGITKNQTKSIVVFQKNGDDVIQPNKFLLVNLPNFEEQEEMKHVISQLNDWFMNTEFYKI